MMQARRAGHKSKPADQVDHESQPAGPRPQRLPPSPSHELRLLHCTSTRPFRHQPDPASTSLVGGTGATSQDFPQLPEKAILLSTNHVPPLDRGMGIYLLTRGVRTGHTPRLVTKSTVKVPARVPAGSDPGAQVRQEGAEHGPSNQHQGQGPSGQQVSWRTKRWIDHKAKKAAGSAAREVAASKPCTSLSSTFDQARKSKLTE